MQGSCFHIHYRGMLFTIEQSVVLDMDENLWISSIHFRDATRNNHIIHLRHRVSIDVEVHVDGDKFRRSQKEKR